MHFKSMNMVCLQDGGGAEGYLNEITLQILKWKRGQ